jgi:DNA mismatch repair protein MutS
MNNLKDLNIEKELLPLFDFTLNSFARKEIFDILKKPLNSINEIESRQNIFKGFYANNDILNDYSYTVLYLNEVYFFLNEEKIENLSQNKFKFNFFESKYEKQKYW